MSLFGWNLYVISGFDYSNIQILIIEINSNRKLISSIDWFIKIQKRIKKIWYRVIAIDMGETNFGSVFDGAVSSSPWLKRTHWSDDLSEFSLSLSTRCLVAIKREKVKFLWFDQANNNWIQFSDTLSFYFSNAVFHHHSKFSFFFLFSLKLIKLLIISKIINILLQ